MKRETGVEMRSKIGQRTERGGERICEIHAIRDRRGWTLPDGDSRGDKIRERTEKGSYMRVAREDIRCNRETPTGYYIV